MKSICFTLMMVVSITLIAVAHTVCAGNFKLPLQHPDEGEDLRSCTSCHETEEDNRFPYRKFNHTLLFGDSHGALANQNQRVCSMCHRPAECSSCHGVNIGIKPSIRAHGDPRGRMPHRGDYVTRHRIDGRINPTKCFRCHGRPKTAKTCAPCHG